MAFISTYSSHATDCAEVSLSWVPLGTTTTCICYRPGLEHHGLVESSVEQSLHSIYWQRTGSVSPCLPMLTMASIDGRPPPMLLKAGCV